MDEQYEPSPLELSNLMQTPAPSRVRFSLVYDERNEIILPSTPESELDDNNVPRAWVREYARTALASDQAISEPLLILAERLDLRDNLLSYWDRQTLREMALETQNIIPNPPLETPWHSMPNRPVTPPAATSHNPRAMTPRENNMESHSLARPLPNHSTTGAPSTL